MRATFPPTLVGRKQTVVIHQSSSSDSHVLSAWVHQGSILGLLVFSFYTDDQVHVAVILIPFSIAYALLCILPLHGDFLLNRIDR